jgi:hypothetical protein
VIFAPEMLAKVLSGEKTVTRRPNHNGECSYVPGRVYAVQPGRGEKAVAHIEIVDVWQERLADITEADAVREGFRDCQEFFAYWRRLYGGPRLFTHVWRIEFSLQAAVAAEGPAE